MRAVVSAGGVRYDDYVSRMARTIGECLAPHLERGKPYAVADFPNYANIGDNAIYLGAAMQLESMSGRAPDYLCTLNTYRRDIAASMPTGTIFLLGGGNFGDIWPRHQAMREDIIASFPHHKIVQLPQSLHFSGRESIERCARIIEAHPNFTLLVRDEPSLELARRHFDCESATCPDTAFCMGPLRRPDRTAIRALALLRDDSESALAGGIRAAVAMSMPVEDWKKPARHDAPFDRLLERLFKRLVMLRPIMMSKIGEIYSDRANTLLNAGIAQLTRTERLVTDRLHGFIIATLLGIPHIVADNAYGKISRYIDCWGCSDLTTLAPDVESLHSFLEREGLLPPAP
ncbi:MAG: polysaccharide pyruvyl transferase family protein [Geminicoccaceae bacterium]